MVVSKCAVRLAEEVWARSVCRPDEPGRWRIGYYDHKGASYVFAVGHGAASWADAFAREAGSFDDTPVLAVRDEVEVHEPYNPDYYEVIEVGIVTGVDITCGNCWEANGTLRKGHE